MAARESGFMGAKSSVKANKLPGNVAPVSETIPVAPKSRAFMAVRNEVRFSYGRLNLYAVGSEPQ